MIFEEVAFEVSGLEIIDGDRGSNYPNKNELSSKGYCLFLNTKNIVGDRFVFNETEFIDEKRDSLLRKGKLQRGDFVITTRGTVGNVGFYSDEVKFERIRINSGMVIVRNNGAEFDSLYLYQLLKSSYIKQQFKSYSSGSAQPQLPIRDLKKIKLLKPPIEIQLGIAEILGSLDDKIELNRRMNETLEQMAMTLFKHWFVDFGPFQNVIESDIPPGWKRASLGGISNILMGQSPKSSFYNYGQIGLPFHQGVSNFGERFPDHEVYSSQILKKANKGDILLSVRAPVGRINIADRDIVIGRGLSAFRHKHNKMSFLLYTLMNIFAIEDSIGSGTVFNAVSKSDLEKIPVIVPPDHIVDEFENQVQEFDSLILSNAIEIRSLTETRNYLLPRLLSGEIAVKAAEEQVQEVIAGG